MSNGILIIGGYGAVGGVIASMLAQQHADQIIIAGRSEAKAAKFTAELGSGVRWRVIDVANLVDYDAAFADVGCVVMCLDVPNIELVRQCFQRGIRYVDISAEHSILAAIAALDEVARKHDATAVLSVGLVPGLSNLMARHSLRFIEPIEHFDSALLAGLGEKHGVGGASWTLSHFSDSQGSASFNFREPYGKKVVHRFAFSDQYTLPQTLPIAHAATWLGFDSSFMTTLIGLARLPLLKPLFQHSAVRRLLLSTTQRLQFGSEEFVLSTVARGARGCYQAWLRGRREAAATGLVTAEVVHRLMADPHPVGVFHIEQLFQLEDGLPLLEQNGMTFSATTE